MIPKQPLRAVNATGDVTVDVNLLEVPDNAIEANGKITITAGTGDVVGPASSTDNAAVRFDSTTGKLVQNSAVIIADTTGNISGTQKVTVGVAGSATGSIELKGTTSGTVTVKPADAAGTWTLTLPTTDGNASDFLQTDGSGVTSWVAGGGGVTNSAGANVLTKSDGTNLVACNLSDDGTTVTLANAKTFAMSTFTSMSGVNLFSTSDTDTGLTFYGSNILAVALGGSAAAQPWAFIGGSAAELRGGNSSQVTWNDTANGWGGAGPSVGIGWASGGVAKITNGSTGGGSLQFQEVTAPSAPSANNCVIFAQDNGAGKTQLMVRFATGASQQIAIEP